MKHPQYVCLWILLIALIYIPLFIYTPFIPMILSLFFAINMATFLMFGMDKLKAQMKSHRIPERLLFLMTFLGGALGTLAGMYIFRHKTKKVSFQLIIAILILVQLGLAYFFLYLQNYPLDLY